MYKKNNKRNNDNKGILVCFRCSKEIRDIVYQYAEENKMYLREAFESLLLSAYGRYKKNEFEKKISLDDLDKIYKNIREKIK